MRPSKTPTKNLYNHLRQKANVEAVDLDGTLAKEMNPYDVDKIGLPVPRMVKRIRNWVRQGVPVVIFTARMSKLAHSPERLKKNRKLIQDYCKKYIGKVLPVTAEKHPMIKRYHDDKARQIGLNTGEYVISAVAKRALRGASRNVVLSRSGVPGKASDVRVPR